MPGAFGFCFAFGPVSVLAPPSPDLQVTPVPVPPEKHVLVLGAAPNRFRRPRQGRTGETYAPQQNHCQLFSPAMPKKEVSNATNIAVFSMATKTSWKSFAAVAKGAHVAVDSGWRMVQDMRGRMKEDTSTTPAKLKRRNR